MLESLLAFNPEKRVSAKTLLENKIFDSFRERELEKPAPYKIYTQKEKISDYRKEILENIK